MARISPGFAVPHVPGEERVVWTPRSSAAFGRDVQLVRAKSFPPDRTRQRRVEVVVDETSAGARRLDQEQGPGVELTGNPGGNTVARDIPRVRQRIHPTKPPVRCEHGDATGA